MQRMKFLKIKVIMYCCLLVSTLLSACLPKVQTIEVTRTVPQTVVVTQLVQVSITTTPLPSKTPIPASPTPEPAVTEATTHPIDLSEQDGGIVLVQYYTLIDIDFYEQAYDLLSSTLKLRNPKDRYLEGEKMFERVVKVLKVIRYNDWLIQKGDNSVQVSDNWYYVQIYVEGENGMAGAYPNGIQDRYIRLTQENGEWKLDEFSTTPY